MKKILVLAVAIATLAFVGCSDRDDSGRGIVVPEGETVDLLEVNSGEKATIKGIVKKLVVKGGEVVVGLTGSVVDIDVPLAATTDKPAIITIEAKPSNVSGEIKNEGKAKIFWTGYDEAQLLEVLTKPAAHNSGALLGANVSGVSRKDQPAAYVIGEFGVEAGYKPTPYDGYVLDGKGFTLSGAAKQNVLHVQSHNVIVRNLTITQTTAQKDLGKSNGICVYRMNGVRIENVTIENCGKGAMIVDASKVTAEKLNTKGNGWDVGVDVSGGMSPTGGQEAPEFTLISGTQEENVKVYVDFDYTGKVAGTDYKVTVPAGWENKLFTVVKPAGSQEIQAFYPKGQAPVFE